MIKTREDSRIEIWDANYINRIGVRHIIDKNAVVIQVEHAHDDSFIVEVIDTEGGEYDGRG